MIQIQGRDQEILNAIYDHRFLLTGHVHRFFFKGADERRARERVAELEKAGLIRREYSVVFGTKRILRLTRAGISFVLQNRGEELRAPGRVDLHNLTHDALVASTRFRLQEFWDATWVPESALKKEDFPQIPDGVMVFPSGSQVAVEVENSPKGPERFRKLQERWRRVPVKLVLYVATTPAMMATLKRYLQAGPQDLPFGLVCWTELEVGVPRVWTVMGEVELFSRRGL